MDANRVAIQGLASGIITTDVTGTPVTSPVTLSSSVTTITIPANAIRMYIANSGATNAMSFSELVGMGTSVTLNTGQSVTLDVGRMGNIYLKSTSGTSCSFYFQLVD